MGQQLVSHIDSLYQYHVELQLSSLLSIAEDKK
ncbi:hypothetical protein PAECIP111802_04887 [Paenibacillus allorhizosphaerae]|uniref:Uncharacterized protein n=1 Tax=Paenibacillus allorhizosphaerae TaxID=2849866 RepID=A0ABM8VN98_9BACL|nr:hypothetical protein PAECIP111802_04887 [Paenibacillus allorhizosphaerae]